MYLFNWKRVNGSSHIFEVDHHLPSKHISTYYLRTMTDSDQLIVCLFVCLLFDIVGTFRKMNSKKKRSGKERRKQCAFCWLHLNSSPVFIERKKRKKKKFWLIMRRETILKKKRVRGEGEDLDTKSWCNSKQSSSFQTFIQEQG